VVLEPEDVARAALYLAFDESKSTSTGARKKEKREEREERRERKKGKKRMTCGSVYNG
jgi:hypothetical protein